jgi:hypothetical protein
MEQQELRSKVVGEARGPIDHVASDFGVVDRRKDPARGVACASVYDQSRHIKPPHQSLQGEASAPVDGFTTCYYQAGFERSSQLRQSVSGMADPHVHREIAVAERFSEAA